jgi:hypothetical protein
MFRPRFEIGRLIRIGVLLASAAAIVPQARAGQLCPGAPTERYQVNVRTQVPPPKINHSLNRAQFGLMVGHLTDDILGMMTDAFKIEYAANYAVEPYGDAYCFWVKDIDVLLRYETPDVYIAREYRRGSCNYKVTLEHEMQHVKVARDYMGRFVTKMRSTLTSLLIPKPKSAVVIESPAKAKREAEQLLQRLIYSVYEQLQIEMGKAQAKVDSPREYKRLGRKCKNW